MERNVIYGNDAPLQGAGIFLVNTQAVLNNNTIALNHQPTSVAGSCGAGIHANPTGTSSATGCNNILYYNQAQSSTQVYGNVSFTYSCVSTGMTGVGNITNNPQFVNYLYYNYQLQSSSPCIDTGDPNSPLDPDGTIADMGALYFNQTPTPILTVSPATLTFNAEAGGGNPSNQTFEISNSGVGSFGYSVSEGTSWLTVSPSSGGAVPPTATETVSVDIAGLSAGTYQGDITVTAVGASGSPATVLVTLMITGNPALEVAPTSLSFSSEVGGANPSNQTFQISNIGGGEFSYNVSESISWLSVSPTNGGPVPPTRSETVSVNTAGLSAGTYQGDITIAASGIQGSPATVHVTLTVTQSPALQVSPSSLSFSAIYGGSNPANQTFQISNIGGGTFSYDVSENIPWLTVSPLSGGPVPPTATETVSVNLSGLSAGTYDGDITVTASGVQGSPATVHVILTITQHPVMSIAPQSLTFYAELGGSDPANQTFQVSNSGSGTFNYVVSESIPWLSVTPSSGGSIPPAATETVSANISGLSAGTYEGDITVMASGVQGSPGMVHVTLVVTQGTILSLSPNHLEFAAELGGNNPANQSFQVANLGSGVFTFSLSESIPWLTVTPNSGGTVPPTASRTVHVSISGLSAGTYEGDISITASGAQGSPGTVHVSLTISQHPALSLSTTSLEFNAVIGGGNPNIQSFQIQNTGIGTFNYSVSESAAWLSVLPGNGGPVPPNATESVAVEINGLSAGMYHNDIIVSASGAEGSPDTVHVTLTVAQNPVLALSAAVMMFEAELGSGNPPNQTFQISNAGTGIFNYAISEAVLWLSVSPMSGGPVPPAATETVSVDITGLSAGDYAGDIIVLASGAQNSPDTVHVSLTIIGNPILGVWPSMGISFLGEVGGDNPDDGEFWIYNSGTGTFSYSITEDIPWLQVSPMHGEPIPPEARETVSVDVSGLTAGCYEGNIIVTAPGAQNSPDTLYVMLTVVQEPVLALSRNNFIFQAMVGGADPPDQSFQIDNAGTGTFDYTISEDLPWLDVAPAGGGPVPPTANATISVDVSELESGIYEGDIIVSAPGVEGSPDTVHVVLNVNAAPLLVIEPTELIFHAMEGGESPLPQIITISNGGGGSLDFQMECNVYWLSLALETGGSIPPSVEDTVSVINIEGLIAGTYEGVIVVSAEDALESPQEVHVILEISSTGIRRIDGIEVPRHYVLNAPYPNPFNPSTNLIFSLPSPGNVALTVYDIRGRKVAELISSWVPAGTYQTTFNASGLSSGMYFCRMVAPGFNSIRKLTFIK